jgi:hypothetical protein
MTDTCTNLGTTASNPNLLQPNKFQLNFARMPNLQYFCQAVSIPGVSLSEVPQTTPFVDLYVPGEKIIYDLLNVTFYVDENIQSWKEVHDWIRAMTFPVQYEEYQNLAELNKYSRSIQTGRPQYSDGMITLLTSSNNPKIRFKFYDLFPVSLSSFVMSASDTPENIITADATFRYSYYNIEIAN